MKTLRFLSLILLAVSAASCGPVSSDGDALILKLKLPDALAKGSNRYQRFLKRVAYLEIITEPGEQDTRTFTFPPGTWEQMVLDPKELTSRSKEALHVLVRVWARGADGNLQTEPVLTGKGKVEWGLLTVTIKLSLKGSVAAFD